MKNELKTITEIMEKRIVIPCYLCGKGEIVIRQGDISLRTPHQLDWEIQVKLKEHLLKETKKFFKKLNQRNKNEKRKQ